MNNTFSILFYPKKNDVNSEGNVPIYVRITVNGKRSEISINRKVNPAKWNTSASKLIGTSAYTREFNNYLDIIKYKLYNSHKGLIEKNRIVTSKAVKNSFLGIEEQHKSVIQIFKYHNAQLKALIWKEYAPATIKRYDTALKHVSRFIKGHFKTDDIAINLVNYKFITDFEFYLKSERNCSHNTAIKYIKNFKKIVRLALANNWIDKDPFLNYNTKIKQVDREYLTTDEIETLKSKKLHTPRLEQVRDIFIFSCFTGLAYIDVKKLTKNDIVKGIDGELWIKIKRAKTKTTSNIPILPTALHIIEKYKNYFDLKSMDTLLPVLSNQKSNAYLKEIAILCIISKNLTTHLARHTFATTVTLSNGVPIESVSKMLGHKSLRTTQHYAKILDRKVSDDMAILKSKLDNLSKSDMISSNNKKII